MSKLNQIRPDAGTFIPASGTLLELHDEALADHFTLGWLMGSLHKQSFELIMLVLAIVAAPAISIVGGLLLLIPALQMIAGRPAPIFPRWIPARPLPARRLGVVVKRVIPMLRYLEKSFHPRCPPPPEVTKRVVGIAVMKLDFKKSPACSKALRDETRRFDLVHRAFADRFFVTDD